MQYVDGWYYLSTATWRSLQLRRAKHLAELADAKEQVVREGNDASRSSNLWAPEFHELPGEEGKPHWFAYYTGNDGKDDARLRMYVAESAGEGILGPYHFKAKLRTDPHDAFYAIDGTVLKRPDGSCHFLWCGLPSDGGQGLCISNMANTRTLAGTRTYLPAKGFGAPVVREGPEALQSSGLVFLIYSCAPTDAPDYARGMLVAEDQADLLSSARWKQYPDPAFKDSEKAKVYGPGHCLVFTSPDGKEDWIVHDAKTGKAHTCKDRRTRTQRFSWRADGAADFGTPLPTGQDITPPFGESR